MCTNNHYNVLVSEYAKRHFIKSFEKKYKSVWNKTFETITHILSHIVVFSRTKKVDIIHNCDTGYIAKCEFNIEGTKISTHVSGNRIIVYVEKSTLEVHILLLYAKTDIGGHQETTGW